MLNRSMSGCGSGWQWVAAGGGPNESKLVVLAKLHFAAIFPGEYDTLSAHDLQLPGDETGIAKFLLCHLPFADPGLQIRPKGYRAARDMFVARDLDGHDLIALLGDLHDLIVMSAIMTYPFAI